MSWQTLVQQQAELDISTSVDDKKAVLIPLPDTDIITVTGDEAETFLQNMVTNNVTSLTVNQAQLNGLCNPKGRLLAIFWLIRREHDFLIVLPSEISTAISQRLNMFKLRSKVEIVLSGSLKAVGLINADEVLSDTPSQKLQATQMDSALVIKMTDQPSRHLLIVDHNQADSLSNWLEQGWQLAPQALWQSQNIQSGVASIFNDSKEQFTPQQVNLDLVGGVSFKKGCYPGQEVVARLHYLGSPSRRMFLGKLRAETLPTPNTAVVDNQANTIGHVVQAQFGNNNEVLCQLSMKLSTAHEEAQVDGNKLVELMSLTGEEV